MTTVPVVPTSLDTTLHAAAEALRHVAAVIESLPHGGLQLYTMGQVAKMLEVAPSMVCKLESQGHLRSVSLGKKCKRFRAEDIERCILERAGEVIVSKRRA